MESVERDKKVSRERAQEECVGEKREEESRNQMCEDSDVSNRHVMWWRKAWWIRIDDGSSMRSARGRRRVWRAAKRAAEPVRDGDGARETQGPAEEAEGETWRKTRKERLGRQSSENTLHIVLHLLAMATATATAPRAAASTVAAATRVHQ